MTLDVFQTMVTGWWERREVVAKRVMQGDAFDLGDAVS